MLKYRALTWIALITFTVWGIFFFPPVVFALIMSGFWGCALWEWTGIMKIKPVFLRFIFMSLIVLISILAYFYLPQITLIFGAIFWLASIAFILKFPEVPSFLKQNNFFKLLLGLLMFVPCWVGFNAIRNSEKGVLFILFAMSLIWMMDTLGYLIGKPFGRHKLLPKLSPGKSIEGLAGGLLLTFFLSIFLFFSDKFPLENNLKTLVAIFIVVILSIVGDLFESLLKRQANVKDSGNLLPGHGGMLDRMDSTLAAVPFFALVLPFIF